VRIPASLRRWWTGSSQYGLLAGLFLLLFFLIFYPLVRLALQSFVFDEHLSLQNYVNALGDRRNLIALYHSLTIGLLTSLFGTVIGAFLAWVVMRTDLPGRRFLRHGLAMPLLIPPFISAIAWMQLLGPVGYLNKGLMALFNLEKPPFIIYGQVGIVLVIVLHVFPLVYLMTTRALEKMDPSLEEAAQISGAGTFRIMRDITLPLMAPTIAGGALLLFVQGVSSFGIPALLGSPRGYYVLTTRIYNAIRAFGVPNNLSLAAALSMLLILVAGAGLAAQRLYLRGKRYTVIGGKGIQPLVVPLYGWRWPLFGLCVLMVFVTVVAPIATILLTSFIRAYGLPPIGENLTLDNYRYILFQAPITVRAIRNSALLATGAALITTVLGFIIAYLSNRTTIRGKYLLNLAALAPYSLPGTVLALAIILAWVKPLPFLPFTLYNTPWIILLAYVTRYLTFPVRTISGAIAQVDDSLEESARVSGASRGRSIRDILLPLISGSVLAGWFLVFMPALRELNLSILLWSVGNETVAVAVFNLTEAGDLTSAAALAMLLIIVVWAGNFITGRISGRQFGL